MLNMKKHKKDKPSGSEGTTGPLTSLLWGDVPLEMSQPYNWKGQQAHKVKLTWSCYSQHQRQVQGLSCSFWARFKTAALIPQTTHCHSKGEDRGQLDVQILISWFNCSKLLNLKCCLWCALGILPFRPVLCLMYRGKNAAALRYPLRCELIFKKIMSFLLWKQTEHFLLKESEEEFKWMIHES